MAPGVEATQSGKETAPAWAQDERRFKVFLSYSRGDSAAFAAGLVKALEAQGLAAKLDTRDLEFGEKWQAQLKDFIRQADAVVYVVSPRSIASKWCRWELAQVAAQSKRLVPVVHVAVKPEELPAEIGEVQLFQARPGIDFRPDDAADLAALAGRLAEGLQKDRAWLQEHTRLTDLAYTWAQEGKSRDHLLRGGALGKAESWMSRRPASAPPPSRGHLDYIAASQVEAKKRGRQWFAGLTAVAVGAASLAGFAWLQRGQALEQRSQALTNQSRILTGLATQSIESGDAVEGALLALAALPEIGNEGERPYVPEAERALYRALEEQRETAVISESGDSRVMGASVSPDGARWFTLSESNELIIGSMETGKRTLHTKGTSDIITGVAWSPDGRRALAIGLDEDGKLDMVHNASGERAEAYLWDLDSGRQVEVINRQKWEIAAAAFSPDSGRLALACAKRGVVIVDASDGRELSATDLGASVELKSVAFSPDGTHFAAGGQSGEIYVALIAENRVLKVLQEETLAPVVFVDYGAEGQVISASWDGKARTWDLSAGTFKVLGEGHKDIILAAALGRDKRHLITGSQDDMARLWSFDTGKETVLAGHRGDVVSVAFSDDGRRALTAAADGTAAVWDVESGRQVAVLDSHDGPLITAIFGRGGESVLISGNRSVRLWSARTMAERRTMKAAGSFDGGLSFSPDGRHLVRWTFDGPAQLWDVRSLQLIRALEKHKGAIIDAQFSSDGKSLVTVSWDETAQRWNGATGEHLGEAAHGLNNWNGASTIGRSGTRLATTDRENRDPSLWDLERGARIAALKPELRTAAQVRLWEFDTAGEILAAVFDLEMVQGPEAGRAWTRDTNVWLWDAGSGKSLGKLSCDKPVHSLAFDLTQGWLAAVAADRENGEIILFEPRASKEVRRIKFSAKGNVGVDARTAFSPDGRMLALAAASSGSIFDLATGEATARFAVRERSLGRLAFDPKGRRLVTLSRDAMHVFDVSSGAEIVSHSWPEYSSPKLSVSPAGGAFATLEKNGDMKLWPLFDTTAELAVKAKNTIPRCLGVKRLDVLGLAAAPPRWCITGPASKAEPSPAKWQPLWPYQSAAWRDWQIARDRHNVLPAPEER